MMMMESTTSRGMMFTRGRMTWTMLYYLNPLPSGTLATFFLTAVGQIKHTEEGDISREKDDPDDVTAAREGRRR
jgi:hypothetical protein